MTQETPDRPEASEANVRKAVVRPATLVLATHGFFKPDQRVKQSDATGMNMLADSGNRGMTRSAVTTTTGEPLENPLPIGDRDARPVVVHDHGQPPLVASRLRWACSRVEGVTAQIVEVDVLQSAEVGGGQHHLGSSSRLERLLPPHGAQAPLVAGLEAGELVLGHGGGQVVAAARRERQELCRHEGTHDVHAGVVAPVLAATRAVVAGEWVERARFELAAEHARSSAACHGKLLMTKYQAPSTKHQVPSTEY